MAAYHGELRLGVNDILADLEADDGGTPGTGVLLVEAEASHGVEAAAEAPPFVMCVRLKDIVRFLLGLRGAQVAGGIGARDLRLVLVEEGLVGVDGVPPGLVRQQAVEAAAPLSDLEAPEHAGGAERRVERLLLLRAKADQRVERDLIRAVVWGLYDQRQPRVGQLLQRRLRHVRHH